MVFTTHTPEKAGNEEHKISTLEVMSFFQGADKEMIAKLAAPDKVNLNYTLTALRMSRRANGVSKLHGEVSQKMWDGFDAICPILSITNAQNRKFWMDKELERHFKKEDDKGIVSRKRAMKCELFKVVANQSGKLFDENALTIVWARRFAEYKRADLLFSDFARFFRMVSNKKFPVQFIWAGKPYPDDHKSVETFNTIFNKTLGLPNCTVLMGYEMELSALLKKGSDAWLNTPRMYREASGTSGMTAAMNGSLNVSMPDGWIPEFAKDKKNCFLVPFTKMEDIQEQDRLDRDALFNLMEQVVIPTYYNKPETWLKIVKQSMQDVVPAFDSDRMADAYYNLMYS